MAEKPPQGDLPMENWGNNFSARITATPSAFGLVAADATAFAALLAAYSSALAVATTPITRTRSTVEAKNQAKIGLRQKALELIRKVSATPTVSNQQRIDLGLNPRDTQPTPQPAPSSRPVLRATADGVVEVVDEFTQDRRGKPAGVRGALMRYTFLPAGAEPPATPDDAKHALLATRARVALPLPEDADMKKLYVLAQWYNERGELGPVSNLAVTTIAA